LRYLRPFALFASNPCFDPTGKSHNANNANGQALSAAAARLSQIEDDSAHLQTLPAEVDEQAQVHAGRSQIVQALRATRAADEMHQMRKAFPAPKSSQNQSVKTFVTRY
jgi:hypothetical protein